MTTSSNPAHGANRLSSAQSPYLRTAAHQPVRWHEWGPEPFALAEAENKPVLLDIGAVWCHWCHVMDGESYENAAIAELINEHFIAVKVDRDERPDVDTRYQKAVQAMTGQGGWPLTVFLTSKGVPYYGGTYFPPEQRYGRAGFPHVLHTVAAAYKDNREQVEQQSSALANYLRDVKFAEDSDLTPEVVQHAVRSIVSAHDQTHGGFGTAPKFPHPSALSFLLSQAVRSGNAEQLHVVMHTLHSMGAGGVYDQLAGGFHRYSTDERWIVPHFEKMLYDNTELLRNYARAFAATGDQFFSTIGNGIVHWMDTVLSDTAHGGFYGSQDADRAFGDDGTYFTWTMADAKAALTAEEFSVAQSYYDICEVGEMHLDTTQNVLFIDRSIDAIAKEQQREIGYIAKLLDSARAKMLSARNARATPYVDQTMYVGWNAMGVIAYFEADAAFGRSDCAAVAVRTLERILAEGFTDRGQLRHTLSPGSPVELFEDYAHLIAALLRAFESTGNAAYCRRAIELTDRAMQLFWDEADGGFFDRPAASNIVGMLDVPHKPIQDSPSPSGNAVMCKNLLALEWWSGEKRFRDVAERALRRFVGEAMPQGLFVAELFSAIDQILFPPLHIVIAGDPLNELTAQLGNAAHCALAADASVVYVDPAATQFLPVFVQAMATSAHLPAAFVCSGTRCYPPCTEPEQLRELLRTFIRGTEPA